MNDSSNWKTQAISSIQNGQEIVADIDIEARTIKYNSKLKLHREIPTITGDEEIVRAFLIYKMVNVLGYSMESIELEKEYQAGRPKTINPRIDIIVRDSSGKAFLFIEVKAPNKFEADKTLIEDQLFKLSRLEGSVSYLVYYSVQTDTLQDEAIIIDNAAFPSYEAWVEKGLPSIADNIPGHYNKPKKEPLIRGGNRDLVTTFTQDELRSLAANLHNVLWGGGGTGDTEIFSSLVNIILAKIQDEYDTVSGEEYKFQIFEYGNEIEKPEKLFERINDLYRKALKDQLYITDDVTDQYVVNRQKLPLNKLLFTVGQIEKYSFVDGKSSLNGKDILGDFFETIQRDGFKQTKGQFFTPTNIVRFILYALEIDNTAIQRLNDSGELPLIIDPACGSGTFLIEAMRIITQEIKYRIITEIKNSRHVQERFNELFMPDNREHRWARHYIYGIEHNFDLGTASKVNMILHGDGSSNIFVKDALLPFRFYDKPLAPNFLNGSQTEPLYQEKEVNANFDIVVSNPPFSVNLDNRTKNYLDSIFIFGGKPNSENLFVERYYQLLRDNGRLGVVLPESVFDTTDNKYIRLFLYKYFHIRAVVSLPQITFEPYTSTKTSLLFAQKKTASQVAEWDKVWGKNGNEWNRLRTRIQNYIKVFVKGGKLTQYPSIKDDDDSLIRSNLSKFLKIEFSPEDSGMSIPNLLKRYKSEIETFSISDNDVSNICGFVNTTWVFEKTTKEIDEPIFMAEVDDIGYKRTKRGEKKRPNQLFDLEIAPDFLDRDTLRDIYNKELGELSAREVRLEADLKRILSNGKNDKASQIKSFKARISKTEKQRKDIQTELDSILETLNTYYDESGHLIEKYHSRHDAELLSLFEMSRLKGFSSDRVLIRKEQLTTVLDHIINTGLWS
ncbi:restriction endonuclease subunit M [Chloroflexota bacterium]